ncbi:MAG: hypothetical protein ACOC41_08760, partial [Chitinivibrionales bacterium]
MPGFYKETYDDKGGAQKPRINIDAVPGPKKAAIVMVALGSQASSEIFRNLEEHDIERLTTEIAQLDDVTSEIREAILEEFHSLAMAQQYISQGGIDYAREILDQALGPRKAK